jgi:hypothetical protein
MLDLLAITEIAEGDHSGRGEKSASFENGAVRQRGVALAFRAFIIQDGQRLHDAVCLPV